MLVTSYKRGQWQLLRSTADDPEHLERTWKEWRTFADKMIKGLESEGITVVEVLIDINKFNEWCQENNKPHISASRSKYIGRLYRREL